MKCNGIKQHFILKKVKGKFTKVGLGLWWKQLGDEVGGKQKRCNQTLTTTCQKDVW